MMVTEEAISDSALYSPQFMDYQLVGGMISIMIWHAHLDMIRKLKFKGQLTYTSKINYCNSVWEIEELLEHIQATTKISNRIILSVGYQEIRRRNFMLECFVSHLKKLIQILREKGCKEIIVTNVPPCAALSQQIKYWLTLQSMNNAITELCQQNDDLFLCNIFNLFCSSINSQRRNTFVINNVPNYIVNLNLYNLISISNPTAIDFITFSEQGKQVLLLHLIKELSYRKNQNASILRTERQYLSDTGKEITCNTNIAPVSDVVNEHKVTEEETVPNQAVSLPNSSTIYPVLNEQAVENEFGCNEQNTYFSLPNSSTILPAESSKQATEDESVCNKPNRPTPVSPFHSLTNFTVVGEPTKKKESVCNEGKISVSLPSSSTVFSVINTDENVCSASKVSEVLFPNRAKTDENELTFQSNDVNSETNINYAAYAKQKLYKPLCQTDLFFNKLAPNCDYRNVKAGLVTKKWKATKEKKLQPNKVKNVSMSGNLNVMLKNLAKYKRNTLGYEMSKLEFNVKGNEIPLGLTSKKNSNANSQNSSSLMSSNCVILKELTKSKKNRGEKGKTNNYTSTNAIEEMLKDKSKLVRRHHKIPRVYNNDEFLSHEFFCECRTCCIGHRQLFHRLDKIIEMLKHESSLS